MKDITSIIIIGSGQIGSRHLQALKAVGLPLNIHVVDPSNISLETAKARYDSMPPGKISHTLFFSKRIPENLKNADIAIIATCSNTRSSTVHSLLSTVSVKYLVLEKILFTRKRDYAKIAKLIKQYDVKTWVNCASNAMPLYNKILPEFRDGKISYVVTGSNYGLVTNAIHYLDHLANLSGCTKFTMNTNSLDKKVITSKRKGFLELTGTLLANFADGSSASLTSFSSGTAPIVVEFHNHNVRCISRENENTAWLSRADDDWTWQELESPIPHQSQRTTWLVEEILKKGTCPLPRYEVSQEIHLQMLDPLLRFINKNSKKKYDHYPFT